MHRAGFIAIVGLPNVGKSTLMNRILGQKVTIVAPRPQTTRNRVMGVKTLPEAQLVLVDTPGLHRLDGRRKTALNRYMVEEALAALESVDVVLGIVEAPIGPAPSGRRAEPPLGGGDRYLAELLAKSGKPTILALNKIDLVRDKSRLLPVLEAWSKQQEFRALVPISAALGDGVERLEAELVQALPEGENLFPEDMLTDRAERWLAAEMIREQVFLLTRQEVPYGAAVTIDTFTERPARGEHAADVVIEATVHVEKEPQKRIVVGEGGRMVREIGTRARAEIGQLLDCPVHLKLFVRVDPDWTMTRAKMREMGYE